MYVAYALLGIGIGLAGVYVSSLFSYLLEKEENPIVQLFLSIGSLTSILLIVGFFLWLGMRVPFAVSQPAVISYSTVWAVQWILKMFPPPSAPAQEHKNEPAAEQEPQAN